MFLKKISLLLIYFTYDFWKFFVHSSVFRTNNQDKLESKINYYYHSIEKGLISEDIRFKFGASKIKKLTGFLNKWIGYGYDTTNSQFISACTVLEKYYELHNEHGIVISDIIPNDILALIIQKYSKNNQGGVVNFTSQNYFKYQNDNFENFSRSRHSIRHFNGELVSVDVIERVVNLAKYAPSVCNRQSARIKLVNEQNLVQEALKIQAGMNATARSVRQLMVVTSNINAFVSEVERNQMFIDGGIFLQNLLYALHHNGLAACALNWSKPFHYDLKLKKLLDINSSERIIAAVAIGYPAEKFKVPFSKRKEVSEILEIIG